MHGNNRTFNKRGGLRLSPLAKSFIAFFSVLIFIGVILIFLLSSSDNSIGSSVGSSSVNSLTKRIEQWIPNHHLDNDLNDLTDVPDWNQEIWTPIDIDVSRDPVVILCKLNFKKYFEQPHSYPMFRDLVTMSNCVANNRRREKLSVLLNEIKSANGTNAGKVIAPTGFVFHESRVGSTLVANFLASDPYALVFSESTPISNAILHCSSCTRERHVQLFRDVLTLMGHSSIHKRMFVKFQSITITNIEIALEVSHSI
jgi:hypothetical protein